MNKAALKRLALELRDEIGLDAYQPFDPYQLAQLYGIDVFQLSDLACTPEALKHLQLHRLEVFSGALVPLGTGAAIVENDQHDPARRRATAAHEMAHVALEHPFAATLVNERGCRTSSPEHEREASELGAEMLLTFEAAKRLAARDKTDAEVASLYGVSTAIARWRMNSTGARRIAERARAKRLAARG